MTDAAVVAPIDPNDVPFASQAEEDAWNEAHPITVRTGKPLPPTASAAPSTQWDGKSDPFAALPAVPLPTSSPAAAPDAKTPPPQDWDGKTDPFEKINA